MPESSKYKQALDWHWHKFEYENQIQGLEQVASITRKSFYAGAMAAAIVLDKISSEQLVEAAKLAQEITKEVESSARI